MKHKLTTDPAGRMFTVETEGTGTVHGLIDFLNHVVFHPQWSPGMSLLVDHRKLSLKDLERQEIEDVVDYFTEISDRLGPGKCALVMNKDVDFGIARASEMMAAGRSQMEIQVFRSMDEAREWLG